MALLAWILAGIITLTAGLTIAEIGAQMPYTGGLYVYIEKIYGRVLGFMGWLDAGYCVRSCYDSCSYRFFKYYGD